MKTQGSKSAPTKNAPKDAKKETVAVLSKELNRRLATAAVADTKRAARKKLDAPPATAPTLPDWAKRAAARDTAAEMAAVPEAAPAPEPPALKKGRAPKPAKAKTARKTTSAATPGSLRAIGDGWLGSLRAAGHTPSTISSYGNDLEIAYEGLGPDAVAAEITEKQIAKFNASDLVTKKKNGKAKAQPTILKTRRALRLALVWAEQKGLIKKAPFPAKAPA